MSADVALAVEAVPQVAQAAEAVAQVAVALALV